MHDNVAHVAAAVHDLFNQFVKVANRDGCEGIVFAAIKVPQQFHHQLVRLAFDVLQAVIKFPGFFQFRHVTQLLDHVQHAVGRFVHHLGLPGKIHPLRCGSAIRKRSATFSAVLGIL